MCLCVNWRLQGDIGKGEISNLANIVIFWSLQSRFEPYLPSMLKHKGEG